MPGMIRKTALSDAAKNALNQRGIAPELAASLGVVSVQAKSGSPDQEFIGFRHYVDGGEHDQWTYRSITGEKRFWQDQGGARVLWNNQNIRDRQLIITEGHLDALAFMMAGFTNVVSVPSGASGSAGTGGKEKFDYIDAAKGALEHITEIVIAVDGDHAGDALHHDLRVRLGVGRCKFLTYPTGCKDANDVLIEHGAEGLVEMVGDAQWVRLDGLYTYSELPPSAPIDAYPTGIAGLDDLWKVCQGRLTVLTGIPGHGKGALITDVVGHLANHRGSVVAMASFEDDLTGTLTPRLKQWKLRGDPSANAEQWMADHFVFISPDEATEETPTVDWVLERIRAAVIRYNVTTVVLDPWNEMDHSAGEVYSSRTEYIGDSLSRLRRQAKNLNYHLIVAAHPAKLHRDKDGKHMMPVGYNISDSANWFNKPDTGLTIYREPDNKVKICCWKCRLDGVIGTRGTEHFSFNSHTMRYTHRPDLEG